MEGNVGGGKESYAMAPQARKSDLPWSKGMTYREQKNQSAAHEGQRNDSEGLRRNDSGVHG